MEAAADNVIHKFAGKDAAKIRQRQAKMRGIGAFRRGCHIDKNSLMFYNLNIFYQEGVVLMCCQQSRLKFSSNW